jgi:hypothetical protein
VPNRLLVSRSTGFTIIRSSRARLADNVGAIMSNQMIIDPDATWEIMGRAMAAALCRAPGFVSTAVPGAWRVTSNVNTWMANWVVCYGVNTAAREVFMAGLDHVVADKRASSIVVSDLARDQLTPAFSALPLATDGANRMFWRDARPLPSNPKLYAGHVTRVEPGADLTAALELVGEAFGENPATACEVFAGALDHSAMSMVTANSDELDSVCITYTEANLTHIYVLGTKPDRQRRGAGWAALAHAMETAIRGGATGFCLMASGAGEPLYQALGYEVCDQCAFWAFDSTV